MDKIELATLQESARLPIRRVVRGETEHGDRPPLEVVSPGNRPHDFETKRREYAEAGIPEYWMVDPEENGITVLVLDPGETLYREHGRFSSGSRATSVLLPGFSVDVAVAITQKPAI